MYGTKLALSNGKSFTEACHRLVGHVLFKVVDAHQEVGITCFQAVLVVKLLNQLHVLYVAHLTLLLVADRVVEGSYDSIGLKHPLVIIELE